VGRLRKGNETFAAEKHDRRHEGRWLEHRHDLDFVGEWQHVQRMKRLRLHTESPEVVEIAT
jgi:hypothetical protein